MTDCVGEGNYDTLVNIGPGLVVDAAFSSEGFYTVLSIRAEVEGLWGGTSPAAGKYTELTFYSCALVSVGASHAIGGVAPATNLTT